MRDYNGRALHICFRKPYRTSCGRCLFLIPTIGIESRYVTDDIPEHKATKYLRLDMRQTRIGIAWLWWQFSFSIAEWRDDRTDAEICGKGEDEDACASNNKAG